MEDIIKTYYAWNQDGGRTLIVYQQTLLFAGLLASPVSDFLLTEGRGGEQCFQRMHTHVSFSTMQILEQFDNLSLLLRTVHVCRKVILEIK